MAKKELTLRDVFMKIERFTKDCYIIHGKCFIEGDDAFRDRGCICSIKV